MESQISQVIVYLIGASIVGLVAAVAKLWHDFNAHRLHSAETYISNGDIEEIKQDIRALRDVVYRIAIRMEVPVLTEPYRR
jgi:hypothetical protein